MKTLAQAQYEQAAIKLEVAKANLDQIQSSVIAADEARDALSQVKAIIRQEAGLLKRYFLDSYNSAKSGDDVLLHFHLSDSAYSFLQDLSRKIKTDVKNSFTAEKVSRAIKPKELLTVAQWAEKNRYINTGTNLPGPWRNENAPHTVEIMNSLSQHSPCREVTFLKASGVSGSEMGWNFIGYTIDYLEQDIMALMPDEGIRNTQFNPQLKRFLKDTPVMADQAYTASKEGTNTEEINIFKSGQKLIKSYASSANKMRAYHVPNLFRDEITGYPQDVDGQGCPLLLSDNRLKAFPRSKTFNVSTPTIKGSCRISDKFRQSDMRYPHLPCPHCGGLFVLEWRHFKIKTEAGDNLKADQVDSHGGKVVTDVHFECPHCKGKVEEKHKLEMLKVENYRWIPKKPQVKHHHGYWINSFYVRPGLGKTWKQIAQMWMDAQGNTIELKGIINNYFAEEWEELSKKLETNSLIARTEYFADIQRPKALRACGIDVQGDRLEITIGEIELDEETWVEKHIILTGDTEQEYVWDELTELLSEERIDFGAIDSGYKTNIVKKYVKTKSFLFAIKGAGKKDNRDIEDNRPFIPSKEDIAKKYRKRNKYEPEIILGVNEGKDAIFSRLGFENPTKIEIDYETGEIISKERRKSPRYIHFNHHSSLDTDYFNQITSEELRTETRRGIQYRYWKKTRSRNEALDCLVYLIASFHIAKAIGRFTSLFKQIEEASNQQESAPTEQPTRARKRLRGR